MLNTALRFMSECERRNIKYHDSHDMDDGKSIVICSFNGKNVARLDIFCIFDAGEKTAGLRVFKLAIVPEEKRSQLLGTLNEINRSYRWLKFIMADDGSISMECDAIISAENSGEICIELMVRAMTVSEEVYPRLMRAIWA